MTYFASDRIRLAYFGAIDALIYLCAFYFRLDESLSGDAVAGVIIIDFAGAPVQLLHRWCLLIRFFSRVHLYKSEKSDR